MRGGSAVLVRHFFSKRLEYLLQGACPGDDHARVNDTKVEQKPEVVQVPIKERVLVIPLDLQANSPLEAIDLMGGRISFLGVNPYLRRKLLLLPISALKKGVDPLSDDALASTPLQD